MGGGWKGGSYFDQRTGHAYSKYPAPSHFVGIKSDKYLIINRCDFETFFGPNDPAKYYRIESSINGNDWNTLYTGSIPRVSKYEQFPYSCEFNPTRCKYIRCTFRSTEHENYSFFGSSFKFYGALASPVLYTNLDAYGIPNEEK